MLQFMCGHCSLEQHVKQIDQAQIKELFPLCWWKFAPLSLAIS